MLEWYEILLVAVFIYCGISAFRIVLFVEFWCPAVLNMVLGVKIALYDEMTAGKIEESEFNYMSEQLDVKKVLLDWWYIAFAPWVWGARMCCRWHVYDRLKALYDVYYEV